MGIKKNIILVSTLEAEISNIIDNYSDLAINISNDINEIKSFCESTLENKVLISYNTNLIIAKEDFEKCEFCINIHAASPRFPGRDPHHWAKYTSAKEYGATLHYMTEKVDNGPIIKVNRFEIKEQDSPADILNKANKEAFRLLEELFSLLSSSELIPIDYKEQWDTKKYKRSDLIKICDLTDLKDPKEFDLRIQSFYSEKFPNLYIKRFNQKFYLKLS
jgi:methionyl-tRNA formyltransferase